MNEVPSSCSAAINTCSRHSAACELSDEQVIQGVIRGDRRAAQELYQRTLPVVVATLRRVLGAVPRDRDDLLQTVYEKLVRSLQTQRFEGACSLSTWASSIAAHAAVDVIRRRVKERHLMLWAATANKPIAEFAGPSTERQLEGRSELAKVNWALSRIKPEQADAILLHDVEGYELTDVAKLTGVSVTAAQSRLIRGRRSIQRKMGATFYQQSSAAHQNSASMPNPTS